MATKFRKEQTCYVFWFVTKSIDIRKAKILSYTRVEKKMGTKYIYTLMRYEIDKYEMYNDSLYFNELIDPKFTRDESEIFPSFTEALVGTVDLLSTLTQRVVNMIKHQ